MAQHYTPIWDDWAEVTQELNSQEKGRLIDAIVAYDNGGDWQEQIKGNERYVFPGYRARIDRWKETCDNRKSAKETDGIKTEQKNQNATKKSESNKTHKDKDKVEDKVEDKDNEKRALTRSQRPSAEEDRAFEKFWLVYPRHEGKQAARKAFDRLNVDDALLGLMVNAITQQRQSAQWSDPRYVPHPATWLNGRRWEDEPVQAGVGKKVSAQMYDQRDYDEAEMEKRLGVDL